MWPMTRISHLLNFLEEQQIARNSLYGDNHNGQQIGHATVKRHGEAQRNIYELLDEVLVVHTDTAFPMDPVS